jgi:hypothetical protein
MDRRYLVVVAVLLFGLSACPAALQNPPTEPVSRMGCERLNGARIPSADAECANVLAGVSCGASAPECKAAGVTCVCQKVFE